MHVCRPMQKDEKKFILPIKTCRDGTEANPPISSARLKIFAARKLDQSVQLANSDGALKSSNFEKSENRVAKGFVLNIVSSAISRVT